MCQTRHCLNTHYIHQTIIFVSASRKQCHPTILGGTWLDESWHGISFHRNLCRKTILDTVINAIDMRSTLIIMSRNMYVESYTESSKNIGVSRMPISSSIYIYLYLRVVLWLFVPFLLIFFLMKFIKLRVQNSVTWKQHEYSWIFYWLKVLLYWWKVYCNQIFLRCYTLMLPCGFAYSNERKSYSCKALNSDPISFFFPHERNQLTFILLFKS